MIHTENHIVEGGALFGDTVAMRHDDGLWTYEHVYAGGLEAPPHAHETAFFCMALSGSAMISGQPENASHDAVYFLPPGVEHSFRIGDDGFHCFDIELEPEWLDHARLYAPIPDNAVFSSDDECRRLMWKAFHELKTWSAASPLVLEGTVLELLALMARQSLRGRQHPSDPPWLQQIEDAVRASPGDKISLQDLAARAGVHPVHLSRVFRARRGESVASFVYRLRIEAAAQHLRDPGASIADIALQLGFSDQSHFTRVFRRLIGVTPAAYRRLVLEGRKSQR